MPIRYKFYKLLRFLHLISKKKYKKRTARYRFMQSPDYQLIKRSKLFDAQWYLAHNPDVKQAGLDPIEHFLKFGWQENRDCTPYFDGKRYLQLYPDVAASYLNPLLHWEKYGKKEGRDAEIIKPHIGNIAVIKVEYVISVVLELVRNIASKTKKFLHTILHRYDGKSAEYILVAESKYFDKKWYLQNYQDVAQKGLDPIEHYLKYGWKEGRNPSQNFSTQEYLYVNKDVKKANINPLIHYLRYGKKEKRAINLKQSLYAKIVRNSKYFNKKWYARYYKNSLKRGEDLVVNYLHNYTHNPGPEFYSNEYLLLNPDVAVHKMMPLVHYENWGWKEKRAISLAAIKPYKFPEKTINIKTNNFKRKSRKHNMVSVLASFSGNGKVADYVVYLLKNLKQISDYIVFVSDNPLFASEIKKIKSYCNVCICERHEEYDFGSYKRGYQYLIKHNILNEQDDLLFINDSCYGPVYPFQKVVEDYKRKSCDFYGLSIGKYPREYIQSFFYIFSRRVYASEIFKNFINGIKKQLSSSYVIYEYEMKFTQYLKEGGFKFSSYVDSNQFILSQGNYALIPTKWTLTLLKKFNYPLVKIKVLQGSSVENPKDILEYVKQENQKLYDILIPHITQKISTIKRPNIISEGNLDEKYTQSLAMLKQKIREHKKIKIMFLVNMTSMFPAEKVMNLMQGDSLFEVMLYVIPDVRFGEQKMQKMLNDTYNELHRKYYFTRKSVEQDETGKIIQWHNIVDNADIVFYPSPYDLSYSLYNPYYAAKNGILSVQLDYGFYRSIYDRFIYQLDNYNNFWRTYIETEFNEKEYRKYGLCKAKNAVVTGYAKMDKLAEYKKDLRKRKSIIIAPHHSIEGGTNDVLALSNFFRYADLFLKLPKMYPNIDFIFRPHPVLFTILSWKRHWGEKKVADYIKKMKSHKNVIYSTEGDYLKEFAQSDGIIQDCGSYLVEYLYTKNPGCYMLKSPKDIKAKFAELGQKCLEQYYLAYNENDIINYINNVILKGEDPKKGAREKFAEDVVMVNYPRASEKVIESIKKELLEN